LSTGLTKTREEMQGLSDLHTLVMRYEDGGRTEVWSTVNKTVRVRGGAKPAEIRAAFEKATP
jgi:hypothetical protein